MPIRRLRLAQRREASGLSQYSLARQIGVNRTTVVRWESGESTPRGVNRAKLGRALGLRAVELDQLIDVGVSVAATSSTLEAQPSNSPAAVDQQADSGDEMLRRDFLQGAVAAGLAAAAPGAIARPIDPLVELRTSVERAARFEQRSQYAALNATLPSLLTTAEQTASDETGDKRREADRLFSIALLVNAFVLIKHDRPTDARSAATAALSLAEASGESVLVGAALRCMAETHLRGGDYELAADLGIEGASYIERSGLLSDEATAIRGANLLSAATARARAGDRRAAYELLQSAHLQAERLGHDVVGTVVFGPTNIAIHHVAFEVELGDPVRALKLAEQMRVENASGLEERRSRHLIDVARAYSARRMDDEAIETLMHAEAISPEETRTHRLTRATITDLMERRPVRMANGLVPLAQRCGIIEAA